MIRLNIILSQGETVLLQLRRPLPGILFRVAMRALPPLAPFAAVIIWPETLERVTEWLNLLPDFWPLIGLVVVLLFITTLPGYALFSLSIDHWRVAITDQRVLARHSWRNIHRDEMARHDIESCLYDRAGGKITLTGAVRELAIACNQRQASRILKALGRDEEAEPGGGQEEVT